VHLREDMMGADRCIGQHTCHAGSSAEAWDVAKVLDANNMCVGATYMHQKDHTNLAGVGDKWANENTN